MVEQIAYFKERWPDEMVPEDQPAWLYYEVAVERDVVTRMIEQFTDGRAVRNSIELAKREGPDQRPVEHQSLVHGPFMETNSEGLKPMDEDDFRLLWDRAVDKPWPQDTR